jgi:hypothetical protein
MPQLNLCKDKKCTNDYERIPRQGYGSKASYKG